MAKAKKQEKPIGQRLEEALVLYEKTPYKLPSNWCWTRLINLVKHQSGNSKLIKGKLSSEKVDGLYDGYSASGQDVFCLNYEHEGDAIIVSAVGARCGKAFLAKGKWSAIANTHIVYPKDGIDIKYLFYLMNDEEWWVRSGSAQPFVVVKESLERPFALAPYQEQKRIVEIIEKQFAKLDEARDLIQASLDSFADRKSAILHKAFTGELTKQWRENNLILQQVNSVDFLECVEDMQNGISKRNAQEGTDFIVLRLADLKENEISTDDNRTIKLTETEIRKYQLKENDVIMIRVNGSKDYVGRQILFNKECNCAYCDHIIRIRYRKDINAKFMLYFSQTREYKDYILQNLVSSAGQNTISRKGLTRLKVNLPILEEQEEIVRILDSIFEKEDKSKEVIDMLDKIDEMKKSILARAFRGQLGTSNPTDEPATGLLRKILAQSN